MPETELGQYRLLRRLGAGGMGEVFLARLEREEGFEKLLVVKRILPQLSESKRFQEMFTVEARVAAALNHPQVVQVTDFGRIGKSCFLAMEYIDGTDLAALIDTARGRKIELPLAFLLGVGLACLRALDYAHRRTPPVIHGDVSPSNVLVGREGEVKISDFGLARMAGRAAGPGEPEIRGKLSYMAPEVARGRPANEHSDLFGVGGILFELACGTPPREARLEQARNRPVVPVSRVKPDVHPALARVIDRALATSPQERYPDATGMEEDLQRISSTLGLDPGPRTVSATVAELGGTRQAAPASGVPRTLVALPGRPGRRYALYATGIFVLIVGLAVYILVGIDRTGGDIRQPDSGTATVVLSEEPPVEVPDAGIARRENNPPAVRRPIRKKATRRPEPVPDAGVTQPFDAGQVAKAAPASQGFRLLSDSPLQCSLDGGPDQAVPLEFNQALSGAHIIRLQSESGLRATIRMEATGEPGQMKLAFRSRPFAVLYINSTPKGLTPKGGIRLGRGNHRISLAPSGDKPMEFTLLLR